MTVNHFVSFENARLLVVDDDPIMREFASVHLATPKVNVDVAEHGEDAWHKMARADYDIALVDLDMPVMNGFELIGLIRGDQRLKHMPIVVVTGREDMVAVDQAYAAGATSFVVKPINWRVLSHQLSYVLRNHREAGIIRDLYTQLQARHAELATTLRESNEGLIAHLGVVLELAHVIEGRTDDPDVHDALRKIASASLQLTDDRKQA